MTTARAGYGLVLAVAIALLALGTAVTHLFLGLQLLSFGGGTLGALFVLNGLGYVGLAALLYLPARVLDPYRGVVRYALIGFAALTIALWIPFGTKDWLGYLNKLNELALIALFVVDSRWSKRR